MLMKSANSATLVTPFLETGGKDGPAAESPDRTRSCLLCLDALRLEIEEAIGAIQSNSLKRLQESIANQATLCQQLEILVAADSGPGRGAGSASTPFSGLMFDSVNKLQATMLDYAALLRRSGQSLSVLAALCRAHLGLFPHAAGEGSCRGRLLGEA